MRRALLVLSAVAALAAPASARAAVTPDRDAPDVAAALSATGRASPRRPSRRSRRPATRPRSPTGCSAASPPTGPASRSSAPATPSGPIPRTSRGSGDNGSAPDPASQRPSVYDLTTLRLDLRVPAGVNCAVFSFRFLTDEAPGERRVQRRLHRRARQLELDRAGGRRRGAEQLRLRLGRERHQRELARLDRPHGRAGDRHRLRVRHRPAHGRHADHAGARTALPLDLRPGRRVFDSAVFLDDLDLQQRPATDCVRGAQDEIAPAVTLTGPPTAPRRTTTRPRSPAQPEKPRATPPPSASRSARATRWSRR